MFKLIWRNTFRHPLRTALTVLGIAVAILAFCLLRTVVAAWYIWVELSSPVRLVTRNAVSIFSPLPLSYLPKIQAIPGIKNVGYAHWFEGIYGDKKNFFPQFAISIPAYLGMFPEWIIQSDQKLALIKDRQGCVAGRKLANRFGWQIGESIVLQGTYFQGKYRFVLRAIYDGKDPNTDDETQFFFHWDYLNETLKETAPHLANQVGWYLIQVERPELAAVVLKEIDAVFENSLAETFTETEAAFHINFVEMTNSILLAIRVVSWLVIGVTLLVLANTMAMNTQERLWEYAVLKTLGFRPCHLARLIVGESSLLALVGGSLGLVFSFPVLKIFPKAVVQYFPGLHISQPTIILGFATSLAVGVLAAVLPVYRATQWGIIKALGRLE